MKCKLLILGLMICIPVSNISYADYLVPPSAVLVPASAFPEPIACCCPKPCKKHVRHYKKKRIKYRKHVRVKHYRSTYCGGRGVTCVAPYHPQPELVSFRMGSGSGRFVNLIDCVPYAPDMSTGDDDPTIYPGMNINN